MARPRASPALPSRPLFNHQNASTSSRKMAMSNCPRRTPIIAGSNWYESKRATTKPESVSHFWLRNASHTEIARAAMQKTVHTYPARVRDKKESGNRDAAVKGG